MATMKDSKTKEPEAPKAAGDDTPSIPGLEIGPAFREAKSTRMAPALGLLLYQEATRRTAESLTKGRKRKVTEADVLEEALLLWAQEKGLL